MAIERPVMLATNIFKDANEINASSEDTRFPAINLLDMTRHTIYRSLISGNQSIEIVRRNLVNNPGAEFNLNDWATLVIAGSPVFTFTRNTVSPLKGNADFKVDITSGAGSLAIRSEQVFDLKKGKTYVLTFMGKVPAGAQVVTALIVDSALATLASDDFGFTTTLSGHVLRFTPTQDYSGASLALIFSTNDTYFFDAMHFNDFLDVDQLIIDQGHNLRFYNMRVQFKVNEPATSYLNPSGGRLTIDDNNIQALNFTPIGASLATHFWRLRLEGITSTIPQISNIWLGKRFVLPTSPESPFDPDKEESFITDVQTEGGFRSSFFKFSQRQLRATFEHLDPIVDFPGWDQWWQDTCKGRDPFWWNFLPITNPRDFNYFRLKNRKRNMPLAPHFRNVTIEADEIGGELAVQQSKLTGL